VKKQGIPELPCFYLMKVMLMARVFSAIAKSHYDEPHTRVIVTKPKTIKL